jgi:3-hydroxybutyryl-CoA dehydratase
MSESLFGRDLDRLEPGASFRTMGRTITETDVVAFAALSGDWHPQHADADWAAGSRFGGRVAHGMLVLSYAVGLVPIDPARVVALRGIDSVVFKRPVRIGDTVHVEGRVEEVRALDPELGSVGFLWKVVNQEGRTAVRARVSVLWRRGGPWGAEGAAAAPPEELEP